MLKPRPYLFELVSSLSKGEVTAFKRSIKHRHGFESYIKLFDYLRKRKDYDEGKLKKDLHKEPVIGFLAVAKNYLYNTILQFLCSPGGEDKEKDLYFRLMAVKKLMDKCLYHHALRIVKKAKKKAYEQENFKVLLELLELEKANNRQILDGRSLSEVIEGIIEEELASQERVNQLLRLQHLYDRINILDKGSSKGEEALLMIEQSSVMRGVPLTSLRSQTLYHRIWAQAKLRTGDYLGLIEDLRQCIDLIEANRTILVDRPFYYGYLEALFNLGNTYILVGDTANAELIDRKLEQIQIDEESKIRVLERQMIIELAIAIQRQDRDSGNELIQRISDNLIKYRGQFHKAKELTLLYAISHYLITMGQFSDANRWLQTLQSEQFSDYRLDYQCYAELLFLVVQCELRNLEGMVYLATNARNRLYRKNRLGQLESRILKLFRQLPGAPDETSEKELLAACKLDLEELYQKPEHHALIHYFDFVKWIESLLQKKAMYLIPSGIYDRNQDISSTRI